MKRSLNELIGYTIKAQDGEIGTVGDFYFDDHKWKIRYMIVDTGTWFAGDKVLISPVALDGPDWESKTFNVNLTKEQIQNSPSIDTDKPVSRQNEMDLHGYYGWPMYWGASMYGGLEMGMGLPGAPIITGEKTEPPYNEPKGDSHLRSVNQVTGYNIHASDGLIGHIVDFMVDDHKWKINYLLADLRTWLPGKKVLLSPKWIKEVSWEESQVFVDMTKDSIKQSPAFDPSKPVSLDFEGELHDYYGKPLN